MKESSSEQPEQQTISVQEDSQTQSTEKIPVSKVQDINSETLTIKPNKLKTEFEIHILEAYKKLIGYDPNKKDNFSSIISSQLEKNSNKKINIKQCEQELRICYNIIINSGKIILNTKIIDKITRIIRHSKINLLLVLGKIFINLMQKKDLFDNLKNENLELNIVINFINEIINLSKGLNETYLGNEFDNNAFNFIENISEKFNFEEEQLTSIKEVLTAHKLKKKLNKINIDSFSDMISSINSNIDIQDNYYSQYQLILDNYDLILGMINQSDINDRNNLNNYLELGKIFAYFIFNKNNNICLKRLTNENDNDFQGEIKMLFDGYEDYVQFNILEQEKYSVEYDEEINNMRIKVCELIMKYIDKYKIISNIFELQYIFYFLAKRIYFHYKNIYKDKIESLLAEIMVNLCFFNTDSIQEILIFIDQILKSSDPEDSNFKKSISKKIELLKSNPNFLYSPEDFSDSLFNLNDLSYENLLLLESDLKLGFFITKKIECGEFLKFYVELSEPYCILDFCMIIEKYDINLTIKNLTEGETIYTSNKISQFNCPLKLTLFFTKPGIFEFDLDNTYSWVRDKIINYKVNVLVPQNPYNIGRELLMIKYRQIILNNKKFLYNNVISSNKDNMLLIKMSGKNKAFNCFDVKQNIEVINLLIKNNYIHISTIYIDKNYFYYLDENRKLIQNNLTRNEFFNYINEKILKTSKFNLEIVNLYIITTNFSDIIDNKAITFDEILGFVPNSQDIIDNSQNKLLFFLQYLHQAQLLYSVYKKINLNEIYDILVLINYNKFTGYQVAIYKDGEILLKHENLKKLNEDESLEKNMELISEELLKISKGRKSDILIMKSNDAEEKNFSYEKVKNILIEKLGKENGNYKIIENNEEFDKELEVNSHIFYLNE